MSLRIRKAIESGNPAFIAYLTAGFPSRTLSPQLLLALQRGGADIIELGVPFSDPIADGPVIQLANQISLAEPNCVMGFQDSIEILKEARNIGVHVPIVLMGYYNPILAIGEELAVQEAKNAGADGFIVVDLPVEEAEEGGFAKLCKSQGLAFIPLAALTTKEERLPKIVQIADSFVYCVSVNGVTGARTQVNDELPAFLERIRKAMSTDKVPLAVGFGISNRSQFLHVAQHAEAVVIGSAIIKVVSEAYDVSKPLLSDPAAQKDRENRTIQAVEDFAASVGGKK